MKHASLFTGIGGFDLAAAWAGWQNIFQVEIDPFCRKVLEWHFPGAVRYSDVKTFNAENYHGAIDIISAGFPCQPFSAAGKRRGTSDDRYLWPETLRIIQQIRPRWMVLENVTGLCSILEPESLSQMEIAAPELFCKSGSKKDSTTTILNRRRILGRVITDILSTGYILPTLEDGTPVIMCIPACAAGAPHRRDRLWIVAHSAEFSQRQENDTGGIEGNNTGGRILCSQPGTAGKGGLTSYPQGAHDRGIGGRLEETAGSNRQGKDWAVSAGSAECTATENARQCQPAAGADTNGQGLEGWPAAGNAQGKGSKRDQHPAGFFDRPGWDSWPTQSPFCGRDDGLPGELDGISFSKWRKESLHAYGNAIVPQVAFEIFSVIAAIETNTFM